MLYSAIAGLDIRPSGGGFSAPYGAPGRILKAGLIVAALWGSGAEGKALKLVAFGDSLTAGYGLKAGEGFTDRLGPALRADGFDVEVINAGASGDTAEDGAARYDWSVPPGADALILELGANDMLRAMPVAPVKAALAEILGKARAAKLKVLIAGMRAARNTPADYRAAFEAVYPDLAKDFAVPLYPFFLQGVVADPALRQADGIHPSAAGVEVIVKAILPAVEDLLRAAAPK